jgi:hypothetical protein
MASKLTALLHRHNPVDLFDLLYSILIARHYPMSRLEVVPTFLRKSIFGPQPSLARDQLKAIPVASFECDWTSLIVPTATAIAFSFVTANFQNLIDSLLAAAATAPAVLAAVGAALRGMPRLPPTSGSTRWP